MKMKYLAFAAALAFSAPAYADNISAGGLFGNVSTQTSTSSYLSLGAYTLTSQIISAFSSSTSGFAAITTSVVDSLNNVVASVNVGATSASPSSSALKSFNITTAGVYSIIFSGGSTPGFTGVTGSVSAVAVPGPEAGAGIGALAMAGLGALAYRRKRLAA